MDIESIALKLQATTDKADRNEGRIKKLESEHEVLHQLATSVAIMGEQLKNMNTNVSALTSKVEELESKPAKKWEAVVEKVIIGFVSALVAFVAAQLF